MLRHFWLVYEYQDLISINNDMSEEIILTVKVYSGSARISFIRVLAGVRSIKEAKQPKKKVSLVDDWYASRLARNHHLDTC